MKTILVSGASGIVGYGILKSLRMSEEKYNLIGTSIYDDTIAEAFCDLFIKTINLLDSILLILSQDLSLLSAFK